MRRLSKRQLAHFFFAVLYDTLLPLSVAIRCFRTSLCIF